MRRFSRTFAIAVLALAPLAAGAADNGDDRAIDTAKSKAQFSVQHVFVEHVTGTIPIASGTVTLPPDSLIPLAATAELAAGKVSTGDRDRDASLQSPDFFDAKQFPAWTFTSTKVTPQGPNAFAMDGLLTIHGVTQPERLVVTIRGDADHPLYHAVGHIERHAFGMTVTRIDPAIGGTADITLDIALK